MNYLEQLSNYINTQSPGLRVKSDQLGKYFELKELTIQDFLFELDDPNKYIYFICEGVFRAYISDEEGNENNLFFCIENDFITGNLDAELKTAFNCQALTKSIVLRANYKRFSKLANENPLLKRFSQKMHDKIHEKIKNRISKDLFSNAKKKYEGFLKDYPGLLNRIPHYYIANYIGITPTQLSRIRKEILK